MSLEQEVAEFNQKLQDGRTTKAAIADELAPSLGEDFAEQIRKLPWHWEVEDCDGTVRFKHNFPYDMHFKIGDYSMGGWDEAIAIVDFTPEEKSVVLSLHLHDIIADFTVRTVVAIRDGEITYFDELYATSDFRYRYPARVARDKMIESKGKTGCLFDTTLKGQLDILPTLVKEAIGSGYGKIASNFFEMIDAGKIDPATMQPPELGR